MKLVTLCLLIKGDQILIGHIKRGFGLGKYNSPGGKVEPGESIRQATVRETEEELGILVNPENLKFVAKIDFYFESKPDWDQQMHVFLCTQWTGTEKETEEMVPIWFRLSDLPYEKMWADDRYWLPSVLEGNRVEGVFHFDSSGAKVLGHEVKELGTY